MQIEHEVAHSTTLLFACLLVAMVITLALEEKLHAKKSIITGAYAIICIIIADLYHLLPIGPVENIFHEKLFLPVFITGIDWEVISIIVGSSLFVDVTSRSGLFSWIALKLTKISAGDPRKLLNYYGVLTVLFSAFLNNVTAMIIVGSLTVVSLKKLNKSEMLLGFLMVEGLLTNVGGLLTLISSVPNIIVGNTAGISFITFCLYSAPFVVVATVITLLLGARLFSIRALSSDDEKDAAVALVESFDENDGITSSLFFYSSAISFTLLILLFATTSNIPYLQDLGLGFVALTFGLLALWVYKSNVDEFYSGLDWDLIWFFMTLFAVINTMEHARVLEWIGGGIETVIAAGPQLGTAGLLWASAVASSVTDNIPLAAVLAKVLGARTPETAASSPLWWSVIFGANLGGNITPIGSASTVVAVTLMQREKLGVTFGRFVRLAAPFAVAQLLIATIYVVLCLR